MPRTTAAVLAVAGMLGWIAIPAVWPLWLAALLCAGCLVWAVSR